MVDADGDPSPSAVTMADAAAAAAAVDSAMGRTEAPADVVPDTASAPAAPAQPYHFRLGNRPPLTGLRALAVLGVLTFSMAGGRL